MTESGKVNIIAGWVGKVSDEQQHLLEVVAAPFLVKVRQGSCRIYVISVMEMVVIVVGCQSIVQTQMSAQHEQHSKHITLFLALTAAKVQSLDFECGAVW